MDTIEQVAAFMRSRGLLLVTAESCTAGLIAATLGDIPGAGKLLDCAFVTYSVDAKQRHLALRESTLQRHNLTSEEVAREMAQGALRNSRANLAISNTGVVDDTDSSIPAGTQCFAWVFRWPRQAPGQEGASLRTFSEKRMFQGDRTAIRVASAHYALSRIPHYYAQL
jgi:nicotinamide-nucleotide amidase